MELNRISPAYDQLLDVLVSGPGIGPNDLRSTHQYLNLRILHGTATRANSTANSPAERIIHIEVTDENDHCFLFVLDIGEHDFHHLKRDQAILVDFPVFPTKLIELIDLCQHSSSSSSVVATTTTAAALASSSSSFSARLDTSTGIFSIVESNVFKQLTHISLQLRPGNDTTIKSYLSSRLTMMLDISKRQSHEISNLSSSLLSEKEQNRLLNQELHDIRAHQNVNIENIMTQHKHELSRFQLLSMQEKEDMRNQYETKNRTLQESLNKLECDYEKKIKDLEDLDAELTSTCHSLEFKLKDTIRRMESAESDRERLSLDLQDVSNQKRQLEETKSSLERDIARLEAQNEGLSRQLQDKDETNNKSIALHRSSEDSREMLKQQLTMMANTISSLQDKVKDQDGELKQSHQTNLRMQEEIKELRNRLGMKSDVIRKQEATVEQLRSKITELERNLNNVNNDMSTLQLKNSTLQRQLEDANQLIGEKDALLESNKQVISYLNEEQSKWQLGFTTTNTISSPNVSKPTTYEIHNVSFSPDTFQSSSGTSLSASAIKTPKVYEYDPKASVLSKKVMSHPSLVDNTRRTDNKDIYTQGLVNLGLGNKVGDFHLDSFEEINGIGIGNDLSQLDYYASAEQVRKPKSISPIPTTQVTPYFNSSNRSKSSSSGMNHSSSNSNNNNAAAAVSSVSALSRKSYAWESPDWIESTLAAGGVRRS